MVDSVSVRFKNASVSKKCLQTFVYSVGVRAKSASVSGLRVGPSKVCTLLIAKIKGGSFRFSFRGNMRCERALVPVFVPGEYPNVPSFRFSFGNHPFGNLRTVDCEDQKTLTTHTPLIKGVEVRPFN